MSINTTIKKVNEAVDFIKSRFKAAPDVGVVLGSGLGPFADLVEEPVSIPFGEIPHFLPTTVAGHDGRLVLGKLHNKNRTKSVTVAVLKGRLHFYEGHGLDEVVFPIRVLGRLGIRTAVLTNAAGGVNPGFREGDLMLVTDHINFSAFNPLKGPNIAELGPRFPDMTEAYDKELRGVISSHAQKLGLELREGVYMWLHGPSYETPAEIRASRILGADAVGMSTVPEVIAARHMGVKIATVSCITNLAAGMTTHKLKHEDVVAVANRAVGKMFDLLQESLPEMK